MPEWTDDSSIRVIVVTADEDFGGVQLHDVPASDFHRCDPDDPADPEGFGTEVTRSCTHWAYRDEIWPRAALSATPEAATPMVDMTPPATSRDRWMYEQGRLAEREDICAAIKAEDDHCVTQGDYMLDSYDCIKVARSEWVRPVYEPAIAAQAAQQGGPA